MFRSTKKKLITYNSKNKKPDLEAMTHSFTTTKHPKRNKIQNPHEIKSGKENPLKINYQSITTKLKTHSNRKNPKSQT